MSERVACGPEGMNSRCHGMAVRRVVEAAAVDAAGQQQRAGVVGMARIMIVVDTRRRWTRAKKLLPERVRRARVDDLNQTIEDPTLENICAALQPRT